MRPGCIQVALLFARFIQQAYNRCVKKLIWIFMAIGGYAGAYLPMLWGDNDFLSYSSVIFSTIGGLLGILLGYKLGQG